MKQRMMLLVSIVMLACAVPATMAADEKVSKEGQEEKERYTGVEHAPHWHDVDADWARSFHNPTDWLSMGLDFRFRTVYAENIITQNKDNDDTWNYQRYRTRWSTKSKLNEDIDFNTRLTWEFRTWDKPNSKSSSTDFDEATWDHMNLTFRNAFDMPLTLVVGRQDIILGTGWLVLEGTPTDGSRTIYFDAVRGTFACDDNTTLDLIYVNQYDDSDKWLKPLSNENRSVANGNNERGAIVYLTNKGESVNTEAYYIYKEDKMQTAAGADAEIHTVGGALSGALNPDWSYRVEGALQFGRKSQEDMQAYGLNSTLAYNFHDSAKSKLEFDYEYLSGDDPDTSKNEAFDPLWGEYPQKNRGGDLPVYMYARETTVAETTNLHRVGLRYTFTPCENWTLNPMINMMWADENTAKNSGTGAYSNDGNFRGQLYSVYLKYQCCKKLSAHWLVDYFIPGNYYASDNRDDALFARFNVEYTF